MLAVHQSTNVLGPFASYHQKPAEPGGQEPERLALRLLDSDSIAEQPLELRCRVEIDVDRREAIFEVPFKARAIL